MPFQMRSNSVARYITNEGNPSGRSYGVPVGGAADTFSMRLANALVGNPRGAPCLELGAGRCVATVQASGWVALAGAGVMQLNHNEVLPGKPIRVYGGETIAVGPADAGNYAYLAFRAGTGASPDWYFPLWKYTPRETHAVIRVLEGPEWPLLQPAAQEYFQASVFRISRQISRMGARLESDVPLLLQNENRMLSVAVAPGTVQCPPGGHPIVLLCDAQTTGGYPRIAQVIAADLPVFAQLRPGAGCRFQLVSLDTAQQALLDAENNLRRLETALELAWRAYI